MGDVSAAAASPAAPASGCGPPSLVERLKEQLREAARRREKLLERQSDAISRLRTLYQELGEAVDADVGAGNGDTAGSIDATGGDADDDGMIEELKRLHDQAGRQLEFETAATEGLNVGVSGETTRLVDNSADTTAAVAGKRRRDDEEEEGKPPSSPREASEAISLPPLQPTDLMIAKGALTVDGESPKARRVAAAFRIATRYIMMTGEFVPSPAFEEAFEAYTGRQMDEDTRQALHDLFAQLEISTTESSNDLSQVNESGDRRTGQWLPGTQYLDTPSLATTQTTELHGATSNDNGFAAIYAYIETEKRLLADVDASIFAAGEHHGNGEAVKALFAQAGFVSTVARGESTTDIHAFLAQRLGRRSKQQCKVTYQTFREFGGVFLQKEDEIRRLVERDQQHSFSALRPGASRSVGATDSSTPGFDKPFSLAKDSITRQLGRHHEDGASHSHALKRRRKTDPMKMLCPYELNGICNDNNCSYLHARDFAGEDDAGEGGGKLSEPVDRKLSLSPEGLAFLASFMATRRKYLAKWPVITPNTFAEMAAVDEVHAKEQAQPAPTAKRMDEGSNDTTAGESMPADASGDGDGWSDYLALDAPDDMPSDHMDAGANVRYYADADQQMADTSDLERLQRRVEEFPDDSDAWLRLAIRQLNLDIPLSDDDARVSEQSRLQLELSTLSKLLHDKARGSHGTTTMDERNVRKCLHVLSRALEVEANLYREAVWLLYLHMCWQISDRQLEEETVEKAIQFVVGSHRLWLRYLSVFRFAKVEKAVAFHGRLLQILCQVTSSLSDEGAEDGSLAGGDAAASQSIALSAVALNLCATLSQVGATDLLYQFLDAVVYGKDGDRAIPQVFSWCTTVREHLSRRDLIALHLMYGHALIYDRLPTCAEDWLASAGCDGIKMGRFAYTIESFRYDFNAVHDGKFLSERRAKLLDVYNHAYEYISAAREEDAVLANAAGDVVLNNWMILIAELYLREGDTTALARFFDEKLTAIQAHPAAAFTASKLLLSHLEDPVRAQQLMLDVLSDSERRHFATALHFYLFASDFLLDLTVALDVSFIHVMSQLATILGADADAIKATIRRIKADDEPISKMRELRALLSQLLSLWMDQLAAAPPLHKQDDKSSARPDIYVGLDICHLMARLLQPTVAIAGLDRILQSSKFWTLDVDSRQLAWSFRFLLQINQLELEAERALPSSDGLSIQYELTQLFKRYMSEMSESSEFARQIELRIGTESDINRAVIECLYPRQHQSLTSDVSLELFQLCYVTVPDRDKPQFFSSYADELGAEPRFALAFAEVAGRGWEWRSARTALQQALVVNSATLWHADIIRATVTGDIKRRRMKAASTLLAAELASHPSSLVTWQLIIALEVLFGDSSAARGESIARELSLRGLPLACNSFGDAALVERGGTLAPAPRDKREQLSWKALHLLVFPRSVLLHSELVSLDLSGNHLVELPSDLDRLQRLETLDVSENALMALPDALARLPNLVSLNVAHNNLTLLPIAGWTSLHKLKTVDCRYNLLSEVAEAAVMAVKGLQELKLDGNAISDDQVRTVTLALERRRVAVTSAASPSIDLTGNSANGQIDLTNSDADESIVVNVDTDEDEGGNDQSKQAEAPLPPPADGISLNIFDLENDLGIGESSGAADVGGIVQSPSAPGEHGSSANGHALKSQPINGQPELPVTPGVIALNKLTEYMTANGITSRAAVRTANPTLWGEFVGANVDAHSSLGACVLCEAPNNDGQHQRLNAVTMCLDCIEDMTARLRTTRPRAMEVDGESKSHK